MAVLAPKAPYSSSMGMGPNQPSVVSQYAVNYGSHKPSAGASSHNAPFVSPTESEFSEPSDAQDSIRSWDEKRVADWLLNNVTGNNLIECDQLVLKEMGIKKIGDRVRIFVAIKQLRTKAVGNHKKRNRDSLAALDNRSLHPPYTPSSSRSPRDFNAARERGHTESSRKRWSQQVDLTALDNFNAANGHPRPGSPLAESDGIKGLRAQRHGGMSPLATARRDPNQGYFNAPPSAKNTTGLRPSTPSRQNPAMDSTVGKLPVGQPVIRVIYGGGQTKVLDIKNYPFDRNERGRLILRKRHAGEPEEEELRKAASIAMEEQNEIHANAVGANNPRSQLKVQKITGETLNDLAYPLSPSTFVPPQPRLRNRAGSAASQGWGDAPMRSDSQSKPKIKEFLGGRPPSELISQDLNTYFPGHQKETIEKTVRMSMRRSARLSRAASRLSTASSNVSWTSSLKDAPPLPNIADTWLGGAPHARGPRPLSVSRFANSQNAYRDSVASTSLQPLAEESPIEPNRKSYVSFDSDSQPGINGTDGDTSHATLQSYFDESGSSGPTTEAGGSLNDHLSHALAADGDEPDEELNQFLKGDSWDNVQWMQGALIGQGSFGSVYLALHAVTGELMAVKQVEVPSNTNSNLDKKKESMVAALKREIDLLRDLQHENIVQYLGSNSDAEHFNIFLEYVPGGSVAAMLNSYGQLKEPLIRNFVRQILTGLSYLHGRDIIHRDIKGANVLVDNKGNIKISDFGISKRVEASAILQPQKNGGHIHRPSLQGSVFWMAPEVVRQTSYTRKADIWSLGCLIVEMFTGTHPFPNCSQLQAIFQIGNSSAKPTIPDFASDEGKIFLNMTFEIDHEKRPSADELLLSPFLKQIA
ncbi:mitogen-activated protein kinase kinase kinase, partial [Lecanoromycetidae sp. Uapishka_2]